MSTGPVTRRSKLAQFLFAATTTVLLAGGECGAPVPVANEPRDPQPVVAGTLPQEATPDPDPGDSTFDDLEGPAILVEAVTNATGGAFDLFDATGIHMLAAANPPGQPLPVPPGTYLLTQQDNPAFVFAAQLRVEQDQLARVPLGAIQVSTVAGSILGWFDIQDSAGSMLLSAANEPNMPVSVPPGAYRLTQSFNPTFVYAAAVEAVAGRVAVVELGAIFLETVPGSVGGGFDVLSFDTGESLSQANAPDTPVAVPPGRYALRQYFNESLTFAGPVAVNAGVVTSVRMGAIRYSGPTPYDLYRGDRLVVSSCSPGDLQTLPPGRYDLYEFFTQRLLQGGVSVTAGQLTEVP